MNVYLLSFIFYSSSELRQAEERAAIAEQFEILQKLRSDHVGLKKRNFYLSNRLVHYFKKQKVTIILDLIYMVPTTLKMTYHTFSFDYKRENRFKVLTYKLPGQWFCFCINYVKTNTIV